MPARERFYCYDSGPFPSGSLHLGHVRTYLLGDVTARYWRSQGRDVLYATEWDAFGLPTEMAAVEAGANPAEWTERCIGRMERQLRQLGVSYDWNRVRRTSDPAYYRFTQELFILLFERGLAYRAEADLNWCPSCETTLADFQAESGACWRCGGTVEPRRMPQWFVRVTAYQDRLLAGLDHLPRWSGRSRKLLGAFLMRAGDWLVSRQRAWGTPIPIVHCGRCGPVAVPRVDLPVQLPDDLDWVKGGRALSDHPAFRDAACPKCGARARRETDTLDCYFDDVWCQFSPLSPRLESRAGLLDFDQSWLPVDRFNSGLDTFVYLHLHRFVGLVLSDAGWSGPADYIGDFQGNEMVLYQGCKMSKHLGNAVSPDPFLDAGRADALRVALLGAAGAERSIEWRPELLDRARWWLGRVAGLVHRVRTRGNTTEGPSTAAAKGLEQRVASATGAVGRFVEEYRPHAALSELQGAFDSIGRFLEPRLANGRLRSADAAIIDGVLDRSLDALGLFAPHLSSEMARDG